MSREQVLAEVDRAVRQARSCCDDVEFSAEDATRSDREFLVQVFRTALAAGATDDEGRFSIPFDPTLISPSGRMFARLFASDHQQVIAGVFNTETAQGLAYAVDTEPIAVSQSATVVNLGTLPVERIGANPPFYIYDSIVEGYLLSERLLAFRPPVRIEVLYPLRNQNGVIEDNGAFYFQNTIHVGRKYVAVRDVLLHEYGHFLADKSGFNQTQGGQHFFPFRARVNASIEWGESWATFFSIAAQVESGRAETLYDSFTSDGGFRYDLEDGHNSEVIAASAQGDDNEGSVQFVLWDLYDGNQDLLPNVAGQRDTVRMSIQDVYNVAAAFATTS